MADLNPDWLLDGKDVDVKLGAAVVTTEYTLAIDSTLAVTITVRDQQRVLLKSGILDRNKDGKLDQGVEIKLDGATYRLAQVKKSGDTFTLGFEDRIAARLRDAKGQMKPRAGEGHVRFAQRLVRLVGGEFVTPTGVAVAKDSTALGHKQARAAADDRREKGIADEPGLTVKGVRANSEQIRNMEIVLGVCAQMQAGPKATLACVEACIVESLFRNLKGGDRDSVGILQARVSIHGIDLAKSVERSVKKFLNSGFTGQGGAITLASQNPGWSAGEIAQAVQGSAHPGRYDQARAEANEIIEAYEGISAVGGAITAAGAGAANAATTGLPTATATTAVPAKIYVQRGTPEEPNEDSWTALQRISKAKGYRCFALRNKVYYAREQDLIRSRPRLTISEASPGVDWIDWEWSPRKKINVATVQCRASLWAAPPGSSVILKDSGGGDGRWLVSSFKRSRDRKSCTVELRRDTELLQPPKTKESTGSVSRPEQAAGVLAGILKGNLKGGETPKKIIDEVVIPIARTCRINVTPESVAAANARHGPTVDGNRSDHQGPPEEAWAADMSNGGAPTPEMDKLARELADAFGIPWTGSGLVNKTSGAYKYQLIYRTNEGGNHYNHVHFGVRRLYGASGA